MKSKTSLFNRTIFKKNITHYWPAWGIYLVYLLFTGPYLMWQNLQSYVYYKEIDMESERLQAMRNVAEVQMLVPVIFIVATLMAMFVFSYLHTARNANMIHALPVTRKELFFSNYLSGLLFLLVPQFLTFLVTVVAALANNVTCIQYAFYSMLYGAGMTIFFYSMAVFVTMFTGQVLAVAAYSFILNMLYVGCVTLLQSFMQEVCYGAEGGITIGKSEWFSPLYHLCKSVGVSVGYDDLTGNAIDIEIYGGKTVLVYTVLGIVLAVAAYLLYQKRKIETAGDLISIPVVKPVFRWGVAVCGGFTLSLLFAAASNQYKINQLYLFIIIGMLIFGTVCFFGAEMLLEKSFRVFKKKRLLECGIMCLCSVGLILLFKVDAFGVEKYQPKAEEIAKAFIYMDYPMEIDEEDIPKVLELQKKVIKNKREYLDLAASTDTGYYYTIFRYYLKDGTCYTRRYPVPTTEKYLAEEDSPATWILAYEADKERLKENILGRNYEKNIYYSGYVDVYDEEDNYQNISISAQDAEKIVKALLADIDAGNMTNLYRYAMRGDDYQEYENGIYLNYANAEGNTDGWSYYNNYFYYSDIKPAENGRLEYAASADIYIRLAPECTNLLKALKEIGIPENKIR